MIILVYPHKYERAKARLYKGLWDWGLTTKHGIVFYGLIGIFCHCSFTHTLLAVFPFSELG